jgi:hypothetical protein
MLMSQPISSGLDISSFDPKAPPPKTPAFWDISDANRAHEDAELADAIDKMGNPDAMTLSQIKDAAARTNSDFFSWISDRKNRRAMPHRLERCGYVPVRNAADKSDGQWKIDGSRVTVYARKALSLKERLGAAAALAAASVRECGKERLCAAAAKERLRPAEALAATSVGESGDVGDSPLSPYNLIPIFAIHENSNQNIGGKGEGE